MSKKLGIMSLSIEPEIHDLLKKHALEDGVSVSRLIRDLVEKHLINKDKFTVIEHNDDIIPVVLKIPVKLRGDARIRDWLKVRCDAIANKLAPIDIEIFDANSTS